MLTARLYTLTFAALLFGRAAAAQTVTLKPLHPTRWDAGVSVGWLGGDKADIAERWNTWYDTFSTSVDLGRYWTPHLKTEAGVTFTSDGAVYATGQIAIPGEPGPAYFSREHRFGLSALNLAAIYQALENSWIHPFIGGGVQLGWERHAVDTPFGPAFSRDGRPFPVPPAPSPETVFDARPFACGGAKFYVAERGFLRSDLSAAFDGRGATRLGWRIGGGIDF